MFIRYTGCTDNIVTNLSKSVYKTEIGDRVLSDHYAQVIQLMEIKSYESRENFRFYRSIGNEGISKLRHSLSNLR